MKAHARQSAKAPKGETCKVNLSIGVETSKRLFVAAIMSNRSASEIADELLRAGLREWSLPSNLAARASSRQSTVSAIHDVSGESVAEIAA